MSCNFGTEAFLTSASAFCPTITTCLTKDILCRAVHNMPSMGLWSGPPRIGRSLFRGNYHSETLAVHARSPFSATTKHRWPCQSLVQQGVTNPDGSVG